MLGLKACKLATILMADDRAHAPSLTSVPISGWERSCTMHRCGKLVARRPVSGQMPIPNCIWKVRLFAKDRLLSPFELYPAGRSFVGRLGRRQPIMPVKSACWCRGLEPFRILSLFSEEDSRVEGISRRATQIEGSTECVLFVMWPVDILLHLRSPASCQDLLNHHSCRLKLESLDLCTHVSDSNSRKRGISWRIRLMMCCFPLPRFSLHLEDIKQDKAKQVFSSSLRFKILIFHNIAIFLQLPEQVHMSPPTTHPLLVLIKFQRATNYASQTKRQHTCLYLRQSLILTFSLSHPQSIRRACFVCHLPNIAVHKPLYLWTILQAKLDWFTSHLISGCRMLWGLFAIFLCFAEEWMSCRSSWVHLECLECSWLPRMRAQMKSVSTLQGLAEKASPFILWETSERSLL